MSSSAGWPFCCAASPRSAQTTLGGTCATSSSGYTSSPWRQTREPSPSAASSRPRSARSFRRLRSLSRPASTTSPLPRRSTKPAEDRDLPRHNTRSRGPRGEHPAHAPYSFPRLPTYCGSAVLRWQGSRQPCLRARPRRGPPARRGRTGQQAQTLSARFTSPA